MERKIECYNDLFDLPDISVGDIIIIKNYNEISVVIEYENTERRQRIITRSLNIWEKIGRKLKRLTTN